MRRLETGIALLLCLVTIGLYSRTLSHEFVYDDEVYIVWNRHLNGGLTARNIAWAFTSTYAANWHPITWLSHLADVTFFGKRPGGHHTTNILLHAANTLLLFTLLLRLTRRPWVSGFAAGVFALHPLRIESVAWVAERKDVLSGFFWMLTMLAYMRFVGCKEENSRKAGANYLLTLLFFVLGLMSKPMLVTLPFVLLLLDFWVLRRVTFGQGGAGKHSKPGLAENGWSTGAWRLVFEKTPFFVIAAFSCIVTYVAQKHGGAMKATEQLPFGVRAANVPVAYVSYIWKSIWPRDLAVFYPHPVRSLPAWQVIGSVLFLTLVTIVLIRLARTHPYGIFGWLWYLGTLVPVIGIIQVGSQAMADRYTYIPQIGLIMALIGTSSNGVRKRLLRDELLGCWRNISPFLGTIMLLTFGTCTAVQLNYWKDPVTLFSRAAAVTRGNFIAHVNLGIALADRGENAAAIPHFEAALRLKPFDPDTHRALADALSKEGRLDDAIEHYRAFLSVRPGDARVRCVVADLLAETRRLDEAIQEYEEVLRIQPDFAEAHTNYGVALVAKGRIPEGISQYREALRLKPDLPDVRYNLGIAYAKLRKFHDAARELRLAVQQKPDDYAARQRLIVILFEIGDYRAVWEQIIEFQKRGYQVPPGFLNSLKQRMPPPPGYVP